MLSRLNNALGSHIKKIKNNTCRIWTELVYPLTQKASEMTDMRMNGLILGSVLTVLGTAAFCQTGVAAPSASTTPPTATNASAPVAFTATMTYIGMDVEPEEPLGFGVTATADQGLMGARLGVNDNNTTGRLLKELYKLDEIRVPEDGDAVKAAADALSKGQKILLLDLPADKILAISDLPQAKDALLFNVRSKDDSLRGKDCRANLFHSIPSRAMLADALTQYLVKMRWNKWFLVSGQGPNDKLYAAALRRSAKRFNVKIVEDKDWTFAAGSRRSDDGHMSEQQTVPAFTQGPDYDVLMVADEGDNFGEYLPYHTYTPRPVAGTQGLVATGWYGTNQAWGATQFQNRFERLAKSPMTERDYAAWVAARTIGEAVTRTKSTVPATLQAYILSSDFAISAFMGTGASYRPWDHQLRSQILLTGPRMLVSFSPQPGFLHEFDTLDTLGVDKPETTCTILNGGQK